MVNSETEVTEGEQALAMSVLGVVGRMGNWLCPSVVGGDEILSGLGTASWELFTMGKEGEIVPFC